MDHLAQDVRFALRGLVKSPAVTAAALVALALGIGANTAIFSAISGLLLEPLPYPEPERIIRLIDTNPEAGFPRFSTAPPDFADWKAENRSFEALAAGTWTSFNLTGGEGDPARLAGFRVSGEFFAVLGRPPLHGRSLGPEDDLPGAAKVAVVSYGLWRGRFGGDPRLVGSSLSLNGEPYTVVGVMDESFDYPSQVELWVPLAMEIGDDLRGAHFVAVIGRLRPGVGIERAQADLGLITRRLAERYPDTNTGWGVRLHRLGDLYVEEVRGPLWILMATVGLVLLIACANVANVVLARIAGRDTEVAVRNALGSSRGRLVRLLLTESVLLALAGGALGLLLSIWGTRALVALSAGGIPRAEAIGIDARVLVFTLLLSLATGLLFGLVPALAASRPRHLGRSLTEGGRRLAGGRRAGLARRALVFAEVAVAVVLLVGAGLLLRSFRALEAVPPGFQPAGALTAQLSLPEVRYPEDEQQGAFYRQLLPRLEAIPGVAHAAAVFPLPLGPSGYVLTFTVDGRPVPGANESPSANIRFGSNDVLAALGVPLLRGRTFGDGDRAGAPRVALINQTMARGLFAGEDPLGQRITFGDPADDEVSWITVVGVVGDVQHRSLDAEPGMEIYLALDQTPMDEATLVLRAASGDPAALAAPLRQAVLATDAELPLFAVRGLEEVVRESLAQRRFNTTLLGTFAVLALVLAAVGVYGVASYAATQRTHEVGLRMALGARRGAVLRLIVRQGMLPVAAGLAVGLALAPLAARVLASLLYGVGTADPLTLATAPAVLALVALLASLLPALRASGVGPAVALRHE